MRTVMMTLAVYAVACLHAVSASAQEGSLTLADVLARARAQAPQIVSARLALEETRARLVGANLRQQSNPAVEAWAGNRHGATDRFTDVEVGLSQGFEPGARRAARLAGANAAVAQGTANVDEVTRDALRLAAAAYYRVLYLDDRIALLRAAEQVATNIVDAADRRYRAGDIAVLDVNITLASLARVRAEREGAEAAKALALGGLRQLLALDTPVAVVGSLAAPAAADLEAALQAASRRPDLRALEAGVQEAEADLRLGASFARPEFGVGVRYAHEEGDHVVLGGMTVTLPLFSKGQEQRALGSARATRLRAELDAARTRIQIEVRAAFDAYTRRLAAVRVLEADAIPRLEQNDQLTTRSFDVGQLGLPELLLIRRETLETRVQYLDALLDAALARIDLDANAGVLQ